MLGASAAATGGVERPNMQALGPHAEMVPSWADRGPRGWFSGAGRLGASREHLAPESGVGFNEITP